MTKNPFYNAVLAAGYVALVAGVMFYGLQSVHPGPTFLVPLAVISLFTLSAAVMGYLFLFAPAELYFVANDRNGAVKLFLQTVGIFAVFTLLFLLALFFTGINAGNQ